MNQYEKFVPNIVIRQGAAILELLAGEEKAEGARREASRPSLVPDHGFHLIYGVRLLNPHDCNARMSEHTKTEEHCANND